MKSASLLGYQKSLDKKYQDSKFVDQNKFMGIKFSVNISENYNASFLLSSNYLKDIDDDNKFVQISFLSNWLVGFNNKKGKVYSIINLLWLINYITNWEDKDLKDGKILYLNSDKGDALLVKKQIELVFGSQLSEFIIFEKESVKVKKDNGIDYTNFKKDMFVQKFLEFYKDNISLDISSIIEKRSFETIFHFIEKIYINNHNELLFSLNLEKIHELLSILNPIEEK